MIPVPSSLSQPWIIYPLLSVKLPTASKVKSPFLVYLYVLPPSGLTTKNPSPWMAKSVFLSVVWTEPCLKIFVIELIWVPSPICIEFLPPSSPWGAVAIFAVWLSKSEKFARLYLKPVVLTFAILLPSTSMAIWWACKPLTPAQSERIIFLSFFWILKIYFYFLNEAIIVPIISSFESHFL